MMLNRSKEWWLAKIDAEPDCPIGAGVPDMPPPANEREAALVAAVRVALSHLGTPNGYFPDIGCPATRRLQAAFMAYEPHPEHWRK